MQKKIEELAAGKCYRKVSLLQCIPEKLEIELLEGAVYSGEFTIKSSEGIPITGKVCATSLRMKCPQAEFQGTTVAQEFEFHSEGLLAGDTHSGNFILSAARGSTRCLFR